MPTPTWSWDHETPRRLARPGTRGAPVPLAHRPGETLWTFTLDPRDIEGPPWRLGAGARRRVEMALDTGPLAWTHLESEAPPDGSAQALRSAEGVEVRALGAGETTSIG